MSDPRHELDRGVARRGTRGGRDAVLAFGDVAREAEALATAAGVVPLVGLATHAVGGRDARDFLHRMLSQDVRTLAAGDARPALFLDARGRIQGDPLVFARADDFLLVEEPAAAARAVPALERYVIADDVTVTDAGAAWAHAWVIGPHAEAVCARARPRLAARGALAARVDLRERPGVRVVAPAPAAAEVVEALVVAGAVRVGEEALDVARVETLVPWFGFELDDRVIPNEPALDAAIAWTKGCYLGQEPVVMAKHRGRPPTRLVRLVLDAGPLPARDAALVDGAATVGRVTTVVHGRAGGLEALGYLRTERAIVGARFALADARAATVIAVA